MSSRRRIAGLLVLALLVFAGCQNESSPRRNVADNEPGPRAGKSPTTPAKPEPPRIVSWKAPTTPTLDWQLAIAHLSPDTTLTYRVPTRWKVERSGSSTSGDDVVRAKAEMTDVDVETVPLSDYLDQLAGSGHTLQLLRTNDGSTAFIVERKVEVAPNEPNSAASYFHTAILLVDGQIAKLELRYPATQKWRYEKIANAVLGTLSIQRSS
jgi:hypothetical protein